MASVIMRVPAMTIRLVPNLSAIAPARIALAEPVIMKIENPAETLDRAQPNSSDKGLRKMPKLKFMLEPRASMTKQEAMIIHWYAEKIANFSCINERLLASVPYVERISRKGQWNVKLFYK